MRTSDLDILIVPGWGNSGPDHWQSRWEAKLPTARRVHQSDWDRPLVQPWVTMIADAMAAARRPMVVVAHSLGVPATILATRAVSPARRPKGLFLVAPPAASVILDHPALDDGFATLGLEPLTVPAVMISSSSDPFDPLREAESLAATLGAAHADAGDAGHLNSESGHGPWPEGLMRFAGFLRTLSPD